MIPRELKKLKQWCVSVSPRDKAPRQPNGAYASVDNPATWSTYEECVDSGYKLIGFVFSEYDPYTCIDLDDHADKPATEEQKRRFDKIIKYAKSYTEISLNKRGYHVIIKGYATNGFHRDNVELFSKGKYVILTGNCLGNKSIEERQRLVDTLCTEYAAMTNRTSQNAPESRPELDDSELVYRAGHAADGDKFKRLCFGDWQADYPSQSEADLALFSILCFYTKNDEQVIRIFRSTELGKRPKAQRDAYMRYNLRRARSTEIPKVDMDEFKKTLHIESIPKKKKKPTKKEWIPSPGLIGEIENYIYSSAAKPVHVIAEAAARAFIAGISGRAYNIYNTGLNQYIILIAGTGKGKEAMASGIERLVSAIRPEYPAIDVRIGPGNFASGQAILRNVDRQKCCVTILGEIGQTLKIISDPKASNAEKMILKVLTDLYSKSGASHVLRANVYSNSEKDTRLVRSPALTILGESNPQTFFEGITETLITNGLIPRFSIMSYDGPRVATNKNLFFKPDSQLVKKIIKLAYTTSDIEHKNLVRNIRVSTKVTKKIRDFSRHIDDLINKSTDGVHAQLWNRVDLKVLKLAGIGAVSLSIDNPVVSTKVIDWAISEVVRETKTFLKIFHDGAFATGNLRQENDIIRVMQEYEKMSVEKRRSYYVPKKIIGEKRLIPFDYIRRRVRRLNSFSNDRRGEVRALRDLMRELVESGRVLQMAPSDVSDKYGLWTSLYVFKW